MWGCDFSAFQSGWLPGVFWPLLLFFLMISLIVIVLILALKYRAKNVGATRDRNDSLSILSARFARGEISRDEFVKMKRLLAGQ